MTTNSGDIRFPVFVIKNIDTGVTITLLSIKDFV